MCHRKNLHQFNWEELHETALTNLKLHAATEGVHARDIEFTYQQLYSMYMKGCQLAIITITISYLIYNY